MQHKHSQQRIALSNQEKTQAFILIDQQEVFQEGSLSLSSEFICIGNLVVKKMEKIREKKYIYIYDRARYHETFYRNCYIMSRPAIFQKGNKSTSAVSRWETYEKNKGSERLLVCF